MSKAKGVRMPPKRIQNVFVVLLLAMFAVSCILLTAIGANLYKNTVSNSEQNNSDRVLAAIVRGAVQGEDAGTVTVEQLEPYGIPSLTFVTDYGDGDIYYRRLFCADGYLRESFTGADYEFDTETGEVICEAAAFEPSLDGNLLTAKITGTDGTTQEVRVHLRAGGVGQ